MLRRSARDGSVLPSAVGVHVLKTGEAWVAGEHPDSFDSRYFGRACPNFCVNGVSFTAEAVAPRTGWEIGSVQLSNPGSASSISR